MHMYQMPVNAACECHPVPFRMPWLTRAAILEEDLAAETTAMEMMLGSCWNASVSRGASSKGGALRRGIGLYVEHIHRHQVHHGRAAE